MTIVRFYDRADDEMLRFAVIVTKSDGHWVFCMHKERRTLEVPGGHREPGEDILTTAKRELYEETGAVDFSIEPVCVYSVTMPGKNDGRETFGMLFFADVKAFEKEIHSEIERIVIQDDLPTAWTYPEIQPYLMAEVQRRQRIRSFWKAVLSQKREDLPAYFAPDAVIRWHCSDEQFTPEEYIRANCDYPGEWDGIIERIDKTQAGYVTVVKVFPADHSASYHVVSFMALENDRIVSLDEYWADDGSAPEWRKKLKIGIPIYRKKESQMASSVKDKLNNNETVRKQYGTADKLSTRISIHSKYSTNKQGFGNWIMSHYQIREEMSVLELGCGTGDMWVGKDDIIRQCSRFILSDFSGGMLDKARETLRDCAGIEYRVIDIQEIPFADGSFDIVIANMMLYHVPDLFRGLREVRRVLKQGGLFYCATFGENGMMDTIADWFSAYPVRKETNRNFTLQNGGEKLSRVFENVRCLLYEDALEVTDVNDMVDYILSLTGMTDLQKLPEDTIRSVLEQHMSGGILRIPKEYGMFIAD